MMVMMGMGRGWKGGGMGVKEEEELAGWMDG